MYVNQATIIGNLTRDPELKSTPTGTQVCSFSIATNHVYTKANGQKEESVEFHNVVAFGKLGENIARYMRKGSHIYIQGRLTTRSWDDKDTGKKMYRTEIIADTSQFGRKAGGEGTQQKQYDASDATMDEIAGGKTQQLETIEYPSDDINPDDIPF